MNLLIWALATGAISLGAWSGIVVWQREERRRLAAREARAAELEEARKQMAELESRVDFAERLLEQERPRHQQ